MIKYSTKWENNLIYITKTKLKLFNKHCLDGKIGDMKFYHKFLNKKDYLSTEDLDKKNLVFKSDKDDSKLLDENQLKK